MFGIVIYLNFILCYLFPGICLLMDLVRNTFIQRKIIHENSFVEERRGYIPKGKVGGIKEQIFIKVFGLENDRNIALSCSYYHGMERGEKYTVTHGKYSKVIVSILSKDNEELMDVHYSKCVVSTEKLYG
jgi:hypothetical protein